MNANHRRFEHSLGVAHLAERMISRLARIQPNLNITEKDKLCVKLAGLCHDLGHGPYSHVYDNTFPKRLDVYLSRNPMLRDEYKGIPEKRAGWEHEDGSLMMIDAILAEMGLAIDDTNLDKPLKQIGDGIENTALRVYDSYDLESDHEDGNHERKSPNKDVILTSRDWIFIKEMIIHKPLNAKNSNTFWTDDKSGFIGRESRQQEFLYDIVANRHSGMDVDKMDYFARDTRRVFRGSGEIDFRLIEEAVVAWGDCPQPHECFRCKGGMPQKHLMICYPDKCVEMCAGFFHRRFKLHATVYRHKTTQASTFMIADILTLADPYFRLMPDNADADEKGLPLSRAMLDPKVYVRMRDSVIDLIEFSQDPRLKPAQEVIRKLRRRELYKCTALRKMDMQTETDAKIWEKTEDQIVEELLQIRGDHGEGRLEAEDIVVEKKDIHMGAKEFNPLLRMRFLQKRNMRLLSRSILNLPEAVQRPEKDFVAHIPKVNQELSLRVFCRGSKSKCELLSHVFAKWDEQCESQYSGAICTNDEQMVDDKPTEIPDGDQILTQPEQDYQGNDPFVSPMPANLASSNSQDEEQARGKARRVLQARYN
jgi:HD superfamily phosphohydrolase